MDFITIIVTALVAGAAAGLKPTAEKAITEGYTAIKGLIQRKYAQVDLTPLEARPASEVKRASVAKDLAEAGAAGDQVLLAQAKALINTIAQHDQATMRAIGIDLEEVKAAYLRVQTVIAEGTGVKVRGSEFTAGIDIGEVEARRIGSPPNP
jgi:hypothetical protein